MNHIHDFFIEAATICYEVQKDRIEAIVDGLVELRERDGKLYIIGMGGSLANAIHMAADLRKLCGIDAEAFDNIAELTARANDEGMATIFEDWLARAKSTDALMVLSVGGGTETVSSAIYRAVMNFEGKVFGIVGPHGGATALQADVAVLIPVANPKHVTPHTEAFQAVIWHAMVSHPQLQVNRTKW